MLITKDNFSIIKSTEKAFNITEINKFNKYFIKMESQLELDF